MVGRLVRSARYVNIEISLRSEKGGTPGVDAAARGASAALWSRFFSRVLIAWEERAVADSNEAFDGLFSFESIWPERW